MIEKMDSRIQLIYFYFSLFYCCFWFIVRSFIPSIMVEARDSIFVIEAKTLLMVS